MPQRDRVDMYTMECTRWPLINNLKRKMADGKLQKNTLIKYGSLERERNAFKLCTGKFNNEKRNREIATDFLIMCIFV